MDFYNQNNYRHSFLKLKFQHHLIKQTAQWNFFFQLNIETIFCYSLIYLQIFK
jgi:hypothetical protein